MKKRTIRFRFFVWLAIHTTVVFLSIGLALLSFDFYEGLENPQNVKEEVEEMAVVVGVMLVLFPVSLVGAWLISRRLLRPWKSMVLQAERIGAGRLEERIEVANPSDEIGRLAATLNQVFDRYQDLLDRLHRFSYDVSHQLRNPLAAIRTTGEVCLKLPRSEGEYRAVIGEILENADRLGRTVQQLLMLARAAEGTMGECMQEVDLQHIAREVVEEGRSIGELRGLTVELSAPDVPIVVMGIPDLLREALANLMDNALKFSPNEGLVRIELSESNPGFARLAVHDSGPGLPPEQKATVFRPFQRGKGAGKESVGLGLAIVADICQVHSARFGVDYRPGGGCSFWMELAVRRPDR
jgi:signal transduction histidine kinase